MSRRQGARIRALETVDARIGGDFRVELAVADIDRVDLRRAAQQQHLREAAGGGPDIEADQALRVDVRRRRGPRRASRRRARRKDAAARP